jgi:hypothetical protein
MSPESVGVFSGLFFAAFAKLLFSSAGGSLEANQDLVAMSFGLSAGFLQYWVHKKIKDARKAGHISLIAVRPVSIRLEEVNSALSALAASKYSQREAQ